MPRKIYVSTDPNFGADDFDPDAYLAAKQGNVTFDDLIPAAGPSGVQLSAKKAATTSGGLSWPHRLATNLFYGGKEENRQQPGETDQAYHQRMLALSDQPERPPLAMPIARGIDAMTAHLTGDKARTLETLVERGTRDPNPEEMSFLNLGLPRPFEQQEGRLPQIGAAIGNLPVNLANFALSPGATASSFNALLSEAPALVRKAVALGFTADQIRHLAHAGTLQEVVEGGLGAALGAYGSYRELPPKAKATAKQLGQTDELQRTPEGAAEAVQVEYPLAREQQAPLPQTSRIGEVPVKAEPIQPASTKNAVTSAERETRGLPQVEEAAARDFGTVWDETTRKVVDDPTVPQRLVESLVENPRPLSDHENALLLRRQIEVQNAHDAAIKAVNEAPDEFSRTEASNQLDDIRNELQKVYDAGESAGTEIGRGLNARKMLANNDYSLAKMEAETRAVVNEGKPLAPKQLAHVKAHHNRIAAAEAKVREYEVREASGLTGDKKRIATMTERLREKTERGDFTKPESKPPRMDDEKAALLFEYQKAKDAYNRGLFEAKLNQQTVGQKALRYTGEVLSTRRAIMTSWDLSAVRRQGKILSAAHPLQTAKQLPEMFRALRSEKEQFRIMQEIRNRPNAKSGLYRQAKLELTEHGPGVPLHRMEEVYQGRFAEKIPGVGASQRAYETFLNRQRADAFDAMIAKLTRKGKPTLEEARAIASYVNIATGRGALGGKFANVAVALNQLFFAPRLFISRFQWLLGQPLLKGSMRTRKLIAAEYARTLGGMAVFYGLAAYAGGKVIEWKDARSSDFLKIRFGDTRLDPLAGLQQATVFMARALTGKIKPVGSGKLRPARLGDTLWKFAESKANPNVGIGMDVWKLMHGEKPPPGHPQSLDKALTQAFLPLPITFGDVYEAMQEQGVPKGVALSILAEFGDNVQTFDTTKRESPTTLEDAMRERKLKTIADFLLKR